MSQVKQNLEQAIVDLSVVADINASLEAQILLGFVLNKNQTWLMAWPEKTISDAEQVQFESYIQRRLKGEPIAYITGQREFWSFELKVTPDTLIPRHETETLIEEVLCLNLEKIQCLDLGTGSGAIALALASENPHWTIKAVDQSQHALVIAQENAQRLNLTNLSFIKSDWFSAINEHDRFELIVSNPPYIEDADPHLDKGDLRFEPRSALAAGEDGLSDLRLIIKTAKTFLKNQGVLIVEHGNLQGQSVRQLFAQYHYTAIETKMDLGGRDRITRGMKA